MGWQILIEMTERPLILIERCVRNRKASRFGTYFYPYFSVLKTLRSLCVGVLHILYHPPAHKVSFRLQIFFWYSPLHLALPTKYTHLEMRILNIWIIYQLIIQNITSTFSSNIFLFPQPRRWGRPSVRPLLGQNAAVVGDIRPPQGAAGMGRANAIGYICSPQSPLTPLS